MVLIPIWFLLILTGIMQELGGAGHDETWLSKYEGVFNKEN